MKNKKIILLIFVLFVLLFTNLCNALIVENPRPIITAEFNEPVIISSIIASLQDSQQNPIGLNLTSISSDNTTFKYLPDIYLDEGDYTFQIQAEDIYGNMGAIKTQTFTIQIPAMGISLISPPFQVAQTNLFDIIIKPTLPFCECRYALVTKEFQNMVSYFSTNDSIYYFLEDFGGNTLTIYTACKSEYNNETAEQSFEFSIDSSPPEITEISAQNVAELPIETTINLNTDEPTVCAYSKQQTNFSNMTIFSELDPLNQEDYKTEHSQFLQQPELQDYSVNTFYIICKNLAQLESPTKVLEIEVQSESSATIDILSPQPNSFHPLISVNFTLFTNKLAKCHFANNSENIIGSGGTFGTFTNNHNTIKQLFAGEHTYYFECLVNTPEGLLPPISTTFTIDTTPPTMEYVQLYHDFGGNTNLTEYTSHDDQLSVKWAAFDNESGIEEYNYTILKDNSWEYTEDIILRNWTNIQSEEDGEEKITITDLSLENEGIYYFKFKAKNKAGLWSLTEYESDGITVDTSLTYLGTCSNGILDSGETDIDCGDVCPACSGGSSCILNSDCLSNFCDPTTKLCVDISDCSNGILDIDETDIDCGGNCAKCISGNACNYDSDCLSNFCDPSTLLCIGQDTCSNGILDSGETDIDCGGTCPPCNLGGSCLTDTDCSSDYCNEENVCESFTLCGNNQINQNEQCDVTATTSCSLFNLEGELTSCDLNCLLDTLICTGPQGECGDGIINPGEQCDGDNIGNIRGCFDIHNAYQSGTIYCQDCKLIMEQCSFEEDVLMDTDNNGMPDVCELKYFQKRTGTDPDADPDNDDLTNQEECYLCNGKSTDPTDPDTDGDGHEDGKEIKSDTNPCNPDDYPTSQLVGIFITIFFILISIGGIIYFLYYKKAITFSQTAPYVNLSPQIHSIKDLQEFLFPTKKTTLPKKPQQQNQKIPPSDQAKVQKPKIIAPLQKLKPAPPPQKRESLKRLMKEQKRKKILGAFDERKKTEESLKLKKLKLKKKN